MHLKKNSILIDFLLVIVVAIAVLISVLTYINVVSSNKKTISNIENTSRYLAITLNKQAIKALDRNSTKEFTKTIEFLKSNSNETIHKVTLNKVMPKDRLKILYSCHKSEIGAVLDIDNLSQRLEGKTEIKIENNHNGVDTFDYIFLLKDKGKIKGMITIVTPLSFVKSEIKKGFILNLIVAIFSIIIIVVFTTFMLFNRIYTPISKLILEVQKIREGEVVYDADIKVHNEFKELEDEINLLKTSLWEHSVEHRFANSTTGLPGLINVINTVTEKIENDEFFGIVSMNINSLEPYILNYGLTNGEDVLKYVAQLIHELLEEHGVKEFNLSHVRETHFILILDPDNAEKMAKDFSEKFDESILDLYKQKEKDSKGTIKFENIDGKEGEYPVINTTVAVMTNKVRGEIKSYKDVENKILNIHKAYYDFTEKSSFSISGTNEDIEEIVEDKVEETGEIKIEVPEENIGEDSSEEITEELDLEEAVEELDEEVSDLTEETEDLDLSDTDSLIDGLDEIGLDDEEDDDLDLDLDLDDEDEEDKEVNDEVEGLRA